MGALGVSRGPTIRSEGSCTWAWGGVRGLEGREGRRGTPPPPRDTGLASPPPPIHRPLGTALSAASVGDPDPPLPKPFHAAPSPPSVESLFPAHAPDAEPPSQASL